MAAVAWALIDFGRIVSTEDEKPIGRAQSMAMVCYATAFVVMLVIGEAQPGGPFAFPGVAGLIAVLGGLSPLLWMMQWLRNESAARGRMTATANSAVSITCGRDWKSTPLRQADTLMLPSERRVRPVRSLANDSVSECVVGAVDRSETQRRVSGSLCWSSAINSLRNYRKTLWPQFRATSAA